MLGFAAQQTQEAVVRQDQCGLCGHSGLSAVVELPPTPPCDAYHKRKDDAERLERFRLDLCVCPDCGFLQLSDIIDPTSVYQDYLYKTSDSIGLREHFGELVDAAFREYDPGALDLVVDIGCNDGTLLDLFKERGVRSIGVEPARHIARETEARGFTVYPGFFTREVAERIVAEHRTAEVVTANNVIANVPNLQEFIQGVRILIGETGLFFFETGYGVDVLTNCLLETINHEHLYYFTVASMRRLLSDNGMELIDVERIASKGGSLRGIAKRTGVDSGPRRSVLDMECLESGKGFGDVETYRAMGSRMKEAGDRIRSYVHALKDRGMAVEAYGASAGATTMLYYLGLGDSVNYLLDDNRDRHGLFSPGYGIPVRSSKEIYERRPDCIIVLAWRYADIIIKKHKKYIDDGGKFVIPLPELKVIH